MASKKDLLDWLEKVLKGRGKSATIVEICEDIWKLYRSELEKSEKLFYTWQYDVRWAATVLRKKGIMKSVKDSRPGKWELK